MPETLLQAAERYAKSGWYLFPLKPRDKKPITTHGLDDASNDLDTIRRWWTQTPQANIGLNCGKSGLVVIDLDMDEKKGENGIAEWKKITEKNRLLVNTSTSITGSGGRHLIFKSIDIPVRNSQDRLALGIDVRGEGGYIVLPPSIHPSGKPYEWLDTTNTIELFPVPIAEILNKEPDPWNVYGLKDAFAPREKLKWIVDGIVPEGSLSIWYGSPGTLKSMVLADLAVSVASGYHWLTNPGEPLSGVITSPAPVMWLDFDNGLHRTHERFAALARARNLPDSTPLYYVSMPDPTFRAGDGDSVKKLSNRLNDRGVKLVIIDNLGVVCGEADENSAAMQQPMAGLRWLAETGVAVIVIHHQRKTTGISSREGESLRGHGSIEAKIDYAILVKRDNETVTTAPTKVRGAPVNPFAAKFSFENDESHELTTARFWSAEVTDEEAEELNQTENAIIAELERFGPMSANQAYDRVGGNRAKVLEIVRTMVKTGKIGQKQGARGFLVYSHNKPG